MFSCGVKGEEDSEDRDPVCATEERHLLKWKEPEGHGEKTKREAACCKTSSDKGELSSIPRDRGRHVSKAALRKLGFKWTSQRIYLEKVGC